MDFIEKFVTFMDGLGYSPDQKIIADDEIHRVKVNGEKKQTHVTYQLKADGDFAVGWVRSFKEGITHSFTSSASFKQMTKGERDAIKAEIEARKKARDAAIDAAQRKAANRAQERWDKANHADHQHPYLKRKKIEPLSARQLGDNLLIPVYSGGKLSSLQTISSQGNKRFLTGGKLQGGYAMIAFKSDSYDEIIICEGYATGVSIRMATGKPVLVAFTAGNLSAIAKSVREKYPENSIIIAADNDAFTTNAKGEPWNPGIEKATEAAKKYNCKLAVPEFTETDGKPTDFNDLHCREGLEAVRLKILQATLVVSDGGSDDPASFDEQTPVTPFEEEVSGHLMEAPPLESYAEEMEREYTEETKQQLALYKAPQEYKQDPNWQDGLIVDKNGNPIKTSLINCDIFIQKCPKFAELFCYDEFAHEKILVNCPPWENPARFKVRPITDDDVTRLAIELERDGIKPGIQIVKKVLDSAIINRQRNPAKEYFSNLKWDGQKRLDNWLIYYCGCEYDREEYVQAVGAKWLTAAVARVFEPGCKFDHMLILEGDQNAGKSTLFRELATIYEKEYFDDTIKITEMGSDKTVPKLQGVLIIEIAELAGFRKSESDALKAAITTQHDRIVKKYQNEATTYPRQFVLAGTINPMDGYLHDATGNRRFWPVKVGSKIDLNAIRADKEQLWAEAVERYRQGEKLYLDEQLQSIAHEAQEDRRTIDPWVSVVANEVNHLPRIGDSAMREIYRKLELRTDRLDKVTQERISKILVHLGFEWVRKQVDGKRTFTWIRKEQNQEELL